VIKRRGVEWTLNAVTYLVLAAMLAPIVWLVLSSFQTSSQLSTGTYDFRHPTLNDFRTKWTDVDIERNFRNSAIICTSAALLATAFAASAGYVLARYRFRGANAFGLSVIGTQLIPGTMFLLPIFLAFVWVGRNTPFRLFDTHIGMILVYTAFFTPVSIFLMRAYFQAIPRELEEAALVDGCTAFGAFWRIILPNAAPGLFATFVYAFLFAWDELLFVTNLTQQNAETIPVGIRTFISNYQQRYDQLMAAGVVATVPVMVAFFATQRWLVRGLTAGSVKG
jgi:multiple sugar transport system permease protein